ncbi:MAG: RNA polymerase factor sigma-54 [Candidatus Bostrichicola ureolyticus]|nr:MAG: RNA polymerase factor sigma-54 [Candidatus Bostrichicola ureolyticus]
MLKEISYQKLETKLSPQQIQLMKLVQLPKLAFEERIIQELEENPAIEEEQKEEIDESYKEENDIDLSYYSPLSKKKNYLESVYTIHSHSLYEHLKNQLQIFFLKKEDYIITEFIIGCLDKDGYLRRSINSIANDLTLLLNIKINESKIEKLICNYIHKLEPYGIGARNLQECLILQLKNKSKTTAIDLAIKIIKISFKEFYKNNYKQIMKKFSISKLKLKEAIYQIKKLNPKPGIIYSEINYNTNYIIPDFIVTNINGQLEISLNNINIPNLKISSSYIEMFKYYKNSKQKNNTFFFIKKKIETAKLFINAIKQRENTLLLTMNAIINLQKEYFNTGDKLKIKPMILKDISKQIGMDVSTISRVVNSKYVSTEYGTFLIKNLFSEKLINKNGKKISTIEVKKILMDFINQENKNKPFTDNKLSKILKNKGYIVARRTISKYREQLNIPIARLRKSF